MEPASQSHRIENSIATMPPTDDNSSVASAAPLAAPAPSAAGPVAQTKPSGTLSEQQSEDRNAGATSASDSGSRSAGGPAESISYSAARVIGNGSFGVVFQATVRETGETVAIKKVLQDKRYKNRELQIMRMLDHTNVVKLKHCFYSCGEKQDEVYLNLVLEYIPETVYRISRHYSKVKTAIPAIFIKLYIFQLLRALAYIHSLNVTHRDIKPQNLLLDPPTQVLKLCDFGSAKILVPDEPNISYICSRYYRAPELIFGATDYLPAIDVWSTGCVMAELMLGQPLFPGESGVDQLVEIIKVLGTPSKAEIMAMNRNYTEFKFPQIRPHPWHKVFRARTMPDAIDLVSRMLQYSPTERLKPMEGLAHVFFDELRSPACVMPNGKPLPPLFNFSEHEFKVAGSLAEKILPLDVHESLSQKYDSPTSPSTSQVPKDSSAPSMQSHGSSTAIPHGSIRRNSGSMSTQEVGDPLASGSGHHDTGGEKG